MFDSNFEKINENKIEYNGLKCEFSSVETWDTDIKDVVITATITYRLNISKDLIIIQTNYHNRFIELFNYLQKLNNLDTHIAVYYLLKQILY